MKKHLKERGHAYLWYGILSVCFVIGWLFCAADDAHGGSGPIIKKTWVYSTDYRVASDSSDVTTNMKAMLTAADSNWTVYLEPAGVYRLSDSVTIPKGVTFDGRGSKIYVEAGNNEGGLWLEDNVTVKNLTIQVDTTETFTGHGGFGTGISIGNYMSGAGKENVTIEDVTVRVNRRAGNAIFITGDSKNISLRNIKIYPGDSTYGGILGHWGGATAPTSGTFHPHNITAVNVWIDSFLTAHSTAVSFSGCYGVSLWNIEALKAKVALSIHPGDYGYTYADTSVYDSTDWSGGLFDVRNFVSYSDSIGLKASGACASVADNFTIPIRLDNFYTCGTEVDATGGVGFYVLNYAGNITAYSSKSMRHYNGFSTGEYVKNITFRDCEFKRAGLYGAYVHYPTGKPDNIFFDACRFDSCVNGIYIQTAKRVTVQNCTFDGSYYGVLMGHPSSDARVILVGNYVNTAINNANSSFLRIDTLNAEMTKPVIFFGNHTYDPSIEVVCVNSEIPFDSIPVIDTMVIDLAKLVIGGGSNGQMLTTNGSGGLSWTTPPGAGSGDDVYYNLGLGGADVDIVDPTIMADSVTGDTLWPKTVIPNPVDSAVGADTATYAKNAGVADSAIGADTSDYANTAGDAVKADSALKASQDGSGNNIVSTYVPYSGATVNIDLNGKGIINIDTFRINDHLYSGDHASWVVFDVYNDAQDKYFGYNSTQGRWEFPSGDTVMATMLLIGADFINELAGHGLVVNSNALKVDTANAVADAETKPVTGNAVYDYVWGHLCPITPDSTEVDTANLREWVADKVGEMVTGNTETNITVTYDDADNTLDFVVSGGGSGIFGDSTTYYAIPDADDVDSFVVKITPEDFRITFKDSCFYMGGVQVVCIDGDGNVVVGVPDVISMFDSILILNYISWASGSDTNKVDYALIDSMIDQTGRFGYGYGFTDLDSDGDIDADTGTQNSETGLATKGFARDSTGAGSGLEYTTETDSGDWSVFAPESPNTGIKLSGNVIVGDSGETQVTDLVIGQNGDTYKMPTGDGSVNQILKTNGSGVVSWAAETGGEGTVDSSILDAGSGTYYSSAAKAWRLKFPYGLLFQAGDSASALDTANLKLDTANAVADAEPKVVTGNAVYDWVTAQSYLTASALSAYMQDEDINTFTELQAWVSDSTLITKETADTLYEGADATIIKESELSGLETDPVYSGDPAFGIESGDISNWDAAYGWGDWTNVWLGGTFSGDVEFSFAFKADSAVPDSEFVTNKRLIDSLTGRADDYATAGHDHDETYLGIAAQAVDADTTGTDLAAALATRADKTAQDSTESWTDTIPSVATGVDTNWAALQTYVTNHAGGAGLTYFSESDSDVYSMWNPTGGNTKMRITGEVTFDSGASIVTDLFVGRNGAVYSFPTEYAPSDGDILKFFDTGDSLGWFTPSWITLSDLTDANIPNTITIQKADTGEYLGSDTDRVLLSDRVDTSTAGLVLDGGNIAMAGAETVDGVDISTISSTYETITNVGKITDDTIRWNTQHYKLNLALPNALYAADHEWCVIDSTEANLTIKAYNVTCDGDPATEVEFSILFADNFKSRTSPTTIDDSATVSGSCRVYGGFGDETVPAGSCIYVQFDAEPDANITQFFVDIIYDYD